MAGILGNTDTATWSPSQKAGMRGFANVEEMNKYDNRDKIVTVDSTTKETSSNNNNQKGVKKKTYSYPLARRNDSKTDYLQIEIAEYQAPGLNLPAFEGTSDKKGNITSITGIKPTREVNGVGTFALEQGSQSQAFTTENYKPEEKRKKLIKYMISLPMPRNITDTTGVQYGEASLNPIEAVGLAGGSALLQGNIDKLKGAFESTFKKGNFDQSTQEAIAAALSGTAIGALGGNVNANQVISRASGQILNPNLELLFQGVGLRVFPLQFQFFPRNTQEGTMVMNILRAFKTEMAPSRTSKEGNANGVFIRTPSIFQLTYKKGLKEHPFLNKFLPAVLSDMKVNYTASGAHSTFYDGTPTHIRLDLQFKELNPLFKEDYDGVGGVGY